MAPDTSYYLYIVVSQQGKVGSRLLEVVGIGS